MRTDPSEMVTLKIPRPLYRRLQQLIEGTGFRSVTEFVTYVMRDLASHPRPEGKRPPRTPEGQLSETEIASIRRRLRELGYL